MLFSGGILTAEEAFDGLSEPMTHGELARKVCLISGIAPSLAQPVTSEVAILAATQKGWAPLGGWRANSYATRDDFYVVVCKYLNLRVEGPAYRPESYYQALVAEGYLAGAVLSETQSKDPSPPRLGTGLVPEASRIVLQARGDVTVRNGPTQDWRPLASYDPIIEGMELRTGADGELDVAYVHGSTQSISPNSVVRIKRLRGGAIAGDAVEVAVEMDSGTAFTIIPVLPDGSKFSIADFGGVIEVDSSEACEVRSVVEKSEVLALTQPEQRLALGFDELAPIRQGRSRHSNFRGRFTGHHFNGKVQIVRTGEGLFFEVAGYRIGPVDNCDCAPLRQAVARLKQLARDHLLTESEIRAFLANLGAGGLCDIHVTPIGR
jgi:hypothetical protein